LYGGSGGTEPGGKTLVMVLPVAGMMGRADEMAGATGLRALALGFRITIDPATETA